MKWEKVKLGDIIEIKKGEYITKKEAKEGPYPVILGGQEPAYYIDHFNHTGKAIVVSRSGASAGYVSFWNEPIFVTDGYMIEPKSKVTFEFLFYLMKHVQSYLQGLQGGAAIPHVNPRIITSIDVRIPSFEAQKCISGIISKYDNLIENNQKQIKLLEEAAQRLYKEWFVDLRFPGHETTPINDGVPEGWTEKRFYELFSFVRGKSYTSKELSDADGILMVNLKSIRPFGGFRRNQEKHYIGKYNADQILEPGDIVMGVTDMTKERRLVGHVALVPDLQEKATFSMDLIKITPFSLPNSYLYSVLHFGGLSAQISQLANGVNVLHLKPEAMMNISMLCPDDSIIAEYDKLFSTIQNRIEILQSECDLAVEARDRLLPKLMNGEIEV